ncbi:MAG: hypothetical protein HY891_02400 [Deltaproteobacteria bacterium]|nr:hypothetical protein [Deltaproteobacteria bacterium]
MKKTFLLIALVVLAGCPARMAAKKGVLPEKKELEVWQVLSQAGEGKTRFNIEDTWYIYCMNISYVPVDRPRQMTNESMGGQCPVEKAEYMVYDKETKAVVRDTVLSQENCAGCHRR